MNTKRKTWRAPDLQPFLHDWRYDPKDNIRLARTAHGREMIVVRRPLGLETYEVDGRPDGARPHGMESTLDVQRRRLAAATARNVRFTLSAAECEDLLREGTTYCHRLICFFGLKDWARAARDAARTLLLIGFVERHAERQEDRARVEQWRATILRLDSAVREILLGDGGVSSGMPLAEPADVNSAEFAADLSGESDRSDPLRAMPFAPPLTSDSSRSAAEPALLSAGDYWTVRFEGQTANLRATRGLLCLRILLRRPYEEVHVSELLATRPERGAPQLTSDFYQGEAGSIGRLAAGGPMLDLQAKAEYKQRLGELQQERADAERNNDPYRAALAQDEMDALGRELAAAVGLGGRDRCASSDAERARSAITKRIRKAISKIAESVPPLGCHLRTSIKTGYFCSYKPPSDRLVHWKL